MIIFDDSAKMKMVILWFTVYAFLSQVQIQLIQNQQDLNKPPFPLINYKAPFGLNDLLGGTPTLKIDRNTGLLTGQPTYGTIFSRYLCWMNIKWKIVIPRIQRDFSIQCAILYNQSCFKI